MMSTNRALFCLLGLLALCFGERALAEDVVAIMLPASAPALPQSVVDFPSSPPSVQVAPQAVPPWSEVPVLFESDPLGAKVTLDSRSLCTTPCRVRVERGVHYVSMELDDHTIQSARVTLDAESVVSFKLAEKPYHFIFMNELSDFGTVITTAFNPTDTKYRFITVLDGTHFLGLSSAIDVGMGGDVFSYRRSQRGAAWSIFGFGPSLRLGRLLASTHIELLSFRRRAPDGVLEGWRPGLSSKLQLPLLTSREARGWATLFPVPTIGVDVWADRELNHDETAFWIGLAWLPGTDF